MFWSIAGPYATIFKDTSDSSSDNTDKTLSAGMCVGKPTKKESQYIKIIQ